MNTMTSPKQTDTQIMFRNLEASYTTERLSDELNTLLSNTLSFNSLVVLGSQLNCSTLCLFDSVNLRKEFLFQRFMSKSFVYDPFYCQVIKEGVEGVFHTEDVLLDGRQPGEYRKQYHYVVEREDELAITVAVDDSRFLALFVGRSSKEERFSEEEKHQLFRQLPTIKKLCQKLCPEDLSLLKDKSEMDLAGKVDRALSTFASDILTVREQEVIILMLQGQANNDIARKLQISVATVKVHRKSIYGKLNVSNLNEFWQLFLNHLVTGFAGTGPIY